MAKFSLDKLINGLLKPPSMGEKPPTVAAAQTMTDRYAFSSLLPYRGWDEEHHGVILNEGKKIAFGYGFEISPLIMAGGQTESQIESVLAVCKPKTMLTFALLSNDDIHHQVNAWLAKRMQNPNIHPILAEMAQRRARFMLEGAQHRSMTPGRAFHARSTRLFVFVRLPYNGEMSDPYAINGWLEECVENRQQVEGSLSSMGVFPELLTEHDSKRLMMQLLNPQFTPEELDRMMPKGKYSGMTNLIPREARMRVRDSDGALIFSGGSRERAVSFITVDQYPETLNISETRNLTGGLLDKQDNISDPHWLWTTIQVMDSDEAKRKLSVALGNMNKQALSESAWMRSMLGPLMKRKDDTEEMLAMIDSGKGVVRMMTGIMVASAPDRVAVTREYVNGLWRKAGFQSSAEPYIAQPLLMAALPWGYSTLLDDGQRGLQRLEMAHSGNAAAAAIVASDWQGHSLACGGPTLFSRRGQIASFDLLISETNYNVTTVADSGGGKSFKMAEVLTTYLSKEGIVRVIDAGRSYQRLAELVGGENLEFNPRERKSLNPFYGIKSMEDLREDIPTLQELLMMMAFPRGTPDDWTSEQMAEAIERTWEVHGETMGSKEIHQWFVERGQNNKEYARIADQLKPYAEGRYADWFNGPPQIALDNDFMILELDNLNADKPFRGVIMSLILNLIIRDLYRASKKKTSAGGIVPKFVLIDEAWDLMGKESGRSGKFIEEAARRIRKYKGTLCTITQSYLDYDSSDASRAAFTNAAWRFSLKQSGPSVSAAREMNVLGTKNEYPWRLLETIEPGKGFSEIHVHNKIGDAFRFITDPFSYYVFTTKAEDRDEIEALTSKGMSTLDALRQLADAKLAA